MSQPLSSGRAPVNEVPGVSAPIDLAEMRGFPLTCTPA